MRSPKPNQAFRWGIILNSIYIIAEVSFGALIGSIALIADAVHNLSDVLGLGISWLANWLGKLAPTKTRTYGYKGSSILAALFNAAFLLVAMGAIIVEAIGRITHPAPMVADTVMLVAGIGIVINGVTALMFHAGQQHDLNIRGAFLHMAGDAGVSLGVVIAGALYLLTGWEWLDPAVSILVAVFVLIETWGLLKDTVDLAMAAVPKDIDPESVRAFICAYPTVIDCHDLHIWALSTTDAALTVHVLRETAVGNDRFLEKLSQAIKHTYDIAHVTIQVEYGNYQPLEFFDNPY